MIQAKKTIANPKLAEQTVRQACAETKFDFVMRKMQSSYSIFPTIHWY